MRLALLGDVHGNELALAAVLAAAKADRVEALLVTGDLVGYYFEPHRVLELLEGWKLWMVRGNHEDMLREAATDPARLAHYESLYGTGLRVALQSLSADRVRELGSLPHPLEVQLGSRRVLLCHGAPWDNYRYIYPDAPEDLLQRCARGGHDLVVLGHTHYAMLRRCGATTIVNPGSVGQPRDRGNAAAWALYDSDSGAVELRREPYAVQEMVEQARLRAPGFPYLAEVLTRG